MLSANETVVVKVHAMQAIANIAMQHPELQNELKVAIEDQLPKTTAAFHARANHILKELKIDFRNKLSFSPICNKKNDQSDQSHCKRKKGLTCMN